MLPDWPTLFEPRPLDARAVRLDFPDFAAPLWFASVGTEDLVAMPEKHFLAEAERRRASAFKFDQPRQNFALGRLAGKLALAGALGTPGEYCEIANGERGEPVVRAEAGRAVAFGVSLSHVNGRGVAVAFPAGMRVGLDLERIDPKRAETVRKGVPLSPAEENWLKQPGWPDATALLALWTAREALGKALGIGMACKWDGLALQEFTTAGAAAIQGRYLYQPAFRCLSWMGPDAVLSLTYEAGA